jgi:hypothetical protein
MDKPADRLLLVVSADWRTRALLAAQLGETTGRSVLSAPGARHALGLARIARLDPAVVVADAGQEMTPAEVEALLEGLPRARLVLAVSALRRAEFEHLRDRSAAFLVRPVTIGALAQAAADALAQANGAHPGSRG